MNLMQFAQYQHLKQILGAELFEIKQYNGLKKIILSEFSVF